MLSDNCFVGEEERWPKFKNESGHVHFLIAQGRHSETGESMVVHTMDFEEVFITPLDKFNDAFTTHTTPRRSWPT